MSTVTVWPTMSLLLSVSAAKPLMVTPAAALAALMTLVPSMALIASVGAVSSTVTAWTLPASP